MINLKNILDKVGWSKSDITKIYVGRSHDCRCGCCGDYFYKGSSGFDEVIAELEDGVNPAHDWCDEDVGVNYVNVDLAGTDDQCYCLYND